jgi:hypothetical protein
LIGDTDKINRKGIPGIMETGMQIWRYAKKWDINTLPIGFTAAMKEVASIRP